MSAEDLGKTLRVEEVGLDEIFNTLRLGDDSQIDNFGLPPLDDLIRSIREARASTTKSQPTKPIVELMSVYPGGGRTHMLYYLTALQVLPIYLGGRQTAVVIVDTDGRFSVSRLVQIVKNLTRHRCENDVSLNLEDIVFAALKHVHIFHPRSLASTVVTLQSLRGYLFDASRHHSFDRAIGFVGIDSVSAFYWQNRAEIEDAALLDPTSTRRSTPPPNRYAQLATALEACSRALSTPILYTTTHPGPLKNLSSFGQGARGVRPSLPLPWQALPTLRLLVQRVSVTKLPMEVTIEDALREYELRQKVVEKGKFECYVNGWGLEERTLQKIQSSQSGFHFHITEDGVRVDAGMTSTT